MDDDRLNPLCCLLRAVIQCSSQGTGNGISQSLVVAADGTVELILVAGQGLFQLLAELLHTRGHTFHGGGHLRQGLCLGFQCLERLLALMVGRQMVQFLPQGRIQCAGCLCTVPAAQGRGQSQHGGGGYTGNGGAKCQAQPGDGGGQRTADGAEFGAVIQGRGGTAQGHDHAGKGAQQAQHHQQAGQVGGELWSGQGGGVAFDTSLRWVLKRLGQGVQPTGNLVLAFRQLVNLPGQLPGLPAKVHQLAETQAIHRANQTGERQRQQVRANKAGANPAHDREADGERQGKEQFTHGVLLTSLWQASSKPSTGSSRTSSSASNNACASSQ